MSQSCLLVSVPSCLSCFIVCVFLGVEPDKDQIIDLGILENVGSITMKEKEIRVHSLVMVMVYFVVW